MFEAVQEQLAENKKHNRQRKRGARYLLQGLLVCKCCDYAYYGKPVSRSAAKGKTRRYAYYRCIGTDAYRFGGERVCYHKQIRTDMLEAAVWEDVRALLNNPSRIEEGLQEPDWMTRREIIRALVKRVEIDKDQVRVVYKVGPPPFVLGPDRGILQDCWRRDNPGYCEGIFNDGQMRGKAWGLRLGLMAATIAPDADPEKEYFTRLVARTYEHHRKFMESPEAHPLGIAMVRRGDGKGDVTIPPWQHDFNVLVADWAARAGFQDAY